MPTPAATSTIVAQAFRLLELRPISSFADDSDQARAAAEQYQTAIDMCLERSDWSFASELANLPEAVPTQPFAADPDLPFVYAAPADCIKIRRCGDRWTRWRADRGHLRASDAAPLPIRYTARITNEAALSASFRTAVAYQLACLLAAAWEGTAAKLQALESGREAAIKRAEGADADQASLERYDGGPPEGDWVTEAIR